MSVQNQENIFAVDGNGNISQETSNFVSQKVALQDRLRELVKRDDQNAIAIANLQLARVHLALSETQEAHALAHSLLNHFLAQQQWEQAAEACATIFEAEQDDALTALGQGIWLAVTYPVDPALTLRLLQHIVDETPDDADGAAVAAAAGLYIVDLRCQDDRRDSMVFFANQILGAVARRHGQVESQDQFSFWFNKLELNDTEKLFVRLRNVIDVLAQDQWWFDRDALQAQLPVN